MRVMVIASVYLLITCTAAAMPPSVNHTDNYTVILTYGQTPHHIGYQAAGNVTGWNWWDTGSGMQQQNLILAMVLDKYAHPVSGLSPPCFSLSQTRFCVGLNTYSWKADEDDIGNYSNDTDIWHWIDLDLTEHSDSELTFYTWYRMTPGDFGYVKASFDDGKTWTELASYTGYQTGVPVQKTIDLSGYDGQKIILAFNFVSDSIGTDEGWYIDDIKVVADGFIVPIFEWRLFGRTIFSDSASSMPPELIVDVAYPTYRSTEYETIKLQEYGEGLYGGVFHYAYNDTYSGTYNIDFTNSINDSDLASVSATFDTTLWGCQAGGCHDASSPTTEPATRDAAEVIHPDKITSSTATDCLTMCHTPYASQFLRATPVHLHEIVYGHLGGFILGTEGWVEIFNDADTNVQMYRKTSISRPLVQGAFNQPSHVTDVGCTDCHTTFLHDRIGSASHQLALTTLHGTDITYGVHRDVGCERCHGGLPYPAFTTDVRSLGGTLNDYVPEFMSYEESTETYIIDVDGTSGINVTVVAEDTDHEFLLSIIGPVDNTATGLGDLNESDPWHGTYLLPSVNGTAIFRAGGKICYPYGEYLNVVTFDSGTPKQGTYVVRILARTSDPFNYTITSNYDIAHKPIIHIPWRCSECHQASPPSGCEGAQTDLVIPDWDHHGLAYTHTDIGDDGSDDVTCRACHNALHDIGILDCVNCHRQPPGGHDSIFSDYLATTYEDCLRCHHDPHYEPELAAGGDCADCHLSGGTNATGGIPIIDRDGFFGSVHADITGDLDYANTSAISKVCWGCHNNYSEQLKDPKHFRIKPDCEDCHTDPDSWNEAYLAPPQVLEHQPDGIDVITAVNCTVCHNKSLVAGMPPETNINNPTSRNFISHYGRKRSDIIVDDGAASDCSYCHRDGGHEFGEVFADPDNADITHGVDCAACHGYGRIHEDVFIVPTMALGNNSLCLACHDTLENYTVNQSLFDSSIHDEANCTDCHTPLPIYMVDIIREGEARYHDFDVPENVKRMNVTLDWAGSDLNLTLIDPSGREINSSVAAIDPDIDHVFDETYKYYSLHNPIDGTWTAIVTGIDVDGVETYTLTIDLLMKHPGTPPHNCEACHVTNISYHVPTNTPLIDEHVTNGTPIDAEVWTEASCVDCHINDIHPDMITGSMNATVSHYGVPEVFDTSDCIACHENVDLSRKWGDAPEPRNVTRYAYVEDASDIENTLRTGDVWKLKNGYEITAGPISSSGKSVWINLTHVGRLVKRELVNEGGVFEYEIRKKWINSKHSSDLYGTGHETYKHRKSGKSSYTTIVDLLVAEIFSGGMRGTVTWNGLILKSRIHVEDENEECYTCHLDEYRYAAPDGDDYIVLRNTGADGETDDSDDITIGRLAINFTEHEHKILHARSGWDLGYGYLLMIAEIDLAGRKARVELSKDGRVLQSEVVPEGGMFRYNTTITDQEGHTIKDVTVFEMRIAGVFRR